MKRRVLSLVRVSTRGQADDEKDGIPRQRRDIEQLCSERNHNLEIDEEFQLKGISGSYVEASPQFQRMLKRLAEPQISGVVFSHMDRFFRPEKLSSYKLFAEFERTKKLMFCNLGALSQSNQQDRMTIQIWAMVAGSEKSNIKERMQKGKDASRRNSSRQTDPLPFFVRFEQKDQNGSGVFHYMRGDVVKLAFERVLKGDSLKTIAEELEFGSPTALRSVLRNPWVYGYKSAQYSRDYGDERRTNEFGELMDATRRVKRTDPILTRTDLADEPLVPKSTFDAVQNLLTQNHKTWTQKKSNANEFLGTGLLHCRCGEKMYHKMDKRPGKPSYYICSTKFNGRTHCGNPSHDAKRTDGEIWFSVMSYFSDDNFIAIQLRRNQDRHAIDQKQDELQQVERDLRKLESKLKNAREFALEDRSFFAEVRTLTAEVAACKAKIDKLKAELQVHLSDAEITETAKKLKEVFAGFNQWPMERKKATLREHLRRITMEDGKAEIEVAAGLPVPAFASEQSRHDNLRNSILDVVGIELDADGH